MKEGYTQYETLGEYYLGFPYMTDFRVVTSIDFAIKHNGIY